jgi:hypothetical protein
MQKGRLPEIACSVCLIQREMEMWHEPEIDGMITFNTLRTGGADLRLYITTVQDGWRKSEFLTRWKSVHLQVLLSATPQGEMFPEVSHLQALLGSSMSISWKFQYTKIVNLL